MGVLVSQHSQVCATTPPPSLSVSALVSMRSGGAIPLPRGLPPSQNRYLSDTCMIPFKKQGKKRAILPSAILSRKGIARYWLNFREWLQYCRKSVLDQNGPKWPKRPFWSKSPYSELDLNIHETKMDQNGPLWSTLA